MEFGVENDAWEVISQLLKDCIKSKTHLSKVTSVNREGDGADYIMGLMSACIIHSGMVMRDTDPNDLLKRQGNKRPFVGILL